MTNPEKKHIGPRHGFSPRQGEEQPRGQFVPTGKFGRLFPELPKLGPKSDSEEEAFKKALTELGNAMTDPSPNTPEGDNDAVPAGFTYFGQFLDHDITFDITSLQETLIDPSALRNFRTPALDLDSVYGAGPSVQPYLYRFDDPDLFLIGKTTASPTARKDAQGNQEELGVFPNDLPRAPESNLGLLGDPRNDENLIVAQLHLAFLKFHNKIVEQIKAEKIVQESPVRKTPFQEARDLVIWHYQWIVLHDFLSRILDPQQLKQVLDEKPSFYKPKSDPFIPLEFSVAAYRLGHTMIRAAYAHNRVFTHPGETTDSRLADGTLELLFEFTAKSGTPSTGPGLNPTLPSNWIIDWRNFFDVDSKIRARFSRKLDPFLVDPLKNLPNVPEPASLAVRNLLRGHKVGLPPGQSVAKFLEFKPLTPSEIASGKDGKVAQKHNFHIESPLWYYILKEAQIQGGGKRLGQVGSRIVAEVFVGLLLADSSSFLVRKPKWKPTLPSEKPGTFTIADLLRFVGDINPIGD